jgi:hypothetical protein
MLGLLFDHLYKFVYLLVSMLVFFFLFFFIMVANGYILIIFIVFICEFWTTFLSYISCISSHQVEDRCGLFLTFIYKFSLDLLKLLNLIRYIIQFKILLTG